MRLLIACGSSGDNTLVAGVSGKIIRVRRIILSAESGVTMKLKDGAADEMCHLYTMRSTVVEENPGDWLFVLQPGNGLVLNLSSAVNVGGAVWYTQEVG